MLTLCIRNFCKSNPVLFILFILLQIISVISILYTYFDYRETVADRYIYAGSAASFSVSFRETADFGELNSDIENIRNDEKNNLDCIYVSLDPEDALRAYMFGQNYIVNYGSNFNKQDETVISGIKMDSDGLAIGDTTVFNSREYKVTGIRLNSYSEIPYASLCASDSVYKINFRLSSLPTNTETDSFLEKLRSTFGEGAMISQPTQRDYSTEYGINTQLLSSYLLFGLSLLNISFIFRYLIQKRKNLYTVSKMCGARSLRLTFLLTAEAALYIIFAIVTGTAVFDLALVPVIFENYVFRFEDFALPLLFYAVFSLIVFIPSLATFSRNTPIEIRRS